LKVADPFRRVWSKQEI